jgi:hypothetical protein
VVVTAEPPSAAERYCAWYGTPHHGTLYFGQAAFWSARRARPGDLAADLHQPGPQPIGRFDLASETLLSPLEVGRPDSRSGVWDVLMGEDGWLYFTTFFEDAGRIDPESRALEYLPALGGGLNELAPGPTESVLATRYGSGQDDVGDGEVIAFDSAGQIEAEWRPAPPRGYRIAPKTAAWDAERGELWVTTDLLPLADGAAIRHDAYVLDRRGASERRIATPEIQFVAVASDGTLLSAALEGRTLRLHVAPPPGAPRAASSVALDAHFPAGLDFVQDIQPAADGRVVVTRWSGRVHVVERSGRHQSVDLPRLDPDGLYYTAVLHGDRLCATYCADVSVVCVDAPR